MKKLIALAALAAVSGAFAACSYTPEVKPTAWAYKWKFSGKTTFGTKPAAVKAQTGLCGWTGTTSTADAGACSKTVRAPASLKIEGYTLCCEPGCGSDYFEKFAEVNEIFWQKKPFKAAIAGGVSTELSHIIGKKAKQFEAAGTAQFDTFVNGTTAEGSYTLVYAGLGKYDAKNDRPKCVKGNFAGFLDQPVYVSKTICENAGYWDCETGALVCGPSVAYGKWSAKFKKSTAKKYLNKGTRPKVAKWALWLNAAE